MLNSELQPRKNDDEKFEILNTESISSDSLTLYLFDGDENPLPITKCYLKTDTVLYRTISNVNGKVKLPFMQADSLIISASGFETARIALQQDVSVYKIKLKDLNPGYVYFTNKEFKYHKGRIYDRTLSGDKSNRKRYYERY